MKLFQSKFTFSKVYLSYLKLDWYFRALFISVKRFLVGRKVTKEIVAPGILDLKAYMNPSAPTANTQLQMVAKISHSGESLNVGKCFLLKSSWKVKALNLF